MIKWIAILLVVLSFGIIALDALNFSQRQAIAQLKWQKEVLANITAEQNDIAPKIGATVVQLTRELSVLQTLEAYKNVGAIAGAVVLALVGIICFLKCRIVKDDALIFMIALIVSLVNPFLVKLIYASYFPLSARDVNGITFHYFFCFGLVAPLFFYIPIWIQNKVERKGMKVARWQRIAVKTGFVLTIGMFCILMIMVLATPDLSGFKN